MCSQTKNSPLLVGILTKTFVAGVCTLLTSIDNGVVGSLRLWRGGQRRNPGGVRRGARRAGHRPRAPQRTRCVRGHVVVKQKALSELRMRALGGSGRPTSALKRSSASTT